MKKVLSVLLVLTMVLCLGLAACGGNKGGDTTTEAPAGNDTTAETPEDTTGAAEIAVVTDVGQLMDKGFNQGTYEGAEAYAKANNISYRYYQPANGSDASDNDRIAAMKQAIDNGAKIIVAPGYLQETAMRAVAAENPDVKFVFVDGSALDLDNVTAIVYKEQESGYLAGYAAVMEGYTKLGFCGGGGGTNPACCRYGYGFVQGASAAAAEMGVTVDMNYSWLYGASFSASPELQTMANSWYEAGTEAIFACGGSMFASVAAAASANDGAVIGVDVDQSFESDTVITSAMKGLSDSVVWALTKAFDGSWDEIGGVATSLGAAENAVGLPTATWSLTGWTVEEYEAMLQDIIDGKVVVDDDYANLAGTDALNLNIVE